MRLERNKDGFCIDAVLLGELLQLPPDSVQELMRKNEITSVCEHGEGEHEGQHRLTFFHGSRRVRLVVDDAGRILKRSIINFGSHPLPRARRGSTSRRPRRAGSGR